MQCLSKLSRLLIKFLSKTLPKSLFYRALRKEQWSTPFGEEDIHSFISGKLQRKFDF